VLQLGDKQVDFHESFRLFLVTRHPSPALPPDVKPLLAVTNFTITRGGLEGTSGEGYLASLHSSKLSDRQPKLFKAIPSVRYSHPSVGFTILLWYAMYFDYREKLLDLH
jgi:hypothetical protein